METYSNTTKKLKIFLTILFLSTLAACKDASIPDIRKPVQFYRGMPNGMMCRQTADQTSDELHATKDVKRIVRKYANNKKMKKVVCLSGDELVNYYAISAEDLGNLYEIIAKLKRELKRK